MKSKRSILLCLALVLSMAMAMGSTLAYLQDSDSDVNVMTLGNVKIEQHEYERAVDSDGNYKTISTVRGTSYELKDFTQAKPLMPTTCKLPSSLNWDTTKVWFAQLGGDQSKIEQGDMHYFGGMDVFPAELTNVQDKFVFVENTGKSDAYVRTIIAFEAGSYNVAQWDEVIKTSRNDFWTYSFLEDTISIDGNNYVVMVCDYTGTGNAGVNGRHPDGIVHPGDYTYNNLSQVYMTYKATNEDCEALDGNKNGTYDILVVSQAVQTAGFEAETDAEGNVTKSAAEVALDEAFGVVSATSHPWLDMNGEGNYDDELDQDPDGIKIPTIFTYEGVNYVDAGASVSATSAGGDTVYRGVFSDGKTTATSVTIGEGITRLNNRALCKAPTLTQVSLPSTLTYIDESVFQQSGFTSIEIPENVSYIGKQAFGACNRLETIVIKAKNVTIANYVARACANLKEVYIHSDTVTFEAGSMYFTNKENGDASDITFYVGSQTVAETLYNAFATSHSDGLLIKSLDGTTTYYNTLK